MAAILRGAHITDRLKFSFHWTHSLRQEVGHWQGYRVFNIANV